MAKKKIITAKSQKFLEEAYLNNASPTGFESEGQKLWLDYIKPYIDTHIVDTYGTVVGVINPDAPYKVVIEAHADEISWFVHYITSDGFIYLRRNGGSDHQIAVQAREHPHQERHRARLVWLACYPHPLGRKRRGPHVEEHLLGRRSEKQGRGGKDGHSRGMRGDLPRRVHGPQQGLVRGTCPRQPRRWLHDCRSGAHVARKQGEAAVWAVHHQLGARRNWLAGRPNDRRALATRRGDCHRRDPLHPHANAQQD